ncbi:hypothetical protein D0Y65_055401 [Glycine soja]|uniref:Uncharacterized protein n=1 Tax=Glycine soja TaxID=3848 RepID=A0A445EXY2_GLYSO|nr:hypothetical protein D0Y65_055401 [Glycine soja]
MVGEEPARNAPMQTLMDYLTSQLNENNNIQLPTLPQGVLFDFKHGFLQMVENNQFNGAFYEDPMMHLKRFLRLCDTIKQPQVSKKYIRLVVFPFSLNGKAWKWLGALLNWTQYSNAFL